MKAEDQDLAGKIVYGTDGIVPAPTYFSLDPTTGEIKVQRDLRQDRRTVYTVSITDFQTFKIYCTYLALSNLYTCMHLPG